MLKSEVIIEKNVHIFLFDCYIHKKNSDKNIKVIF